MVRALVPKTPPPKKASFSRGSPQDAARGAAEESEGKRRAGRRDEEGGGRRERTEAQSMRTERTITHDNARSRSVFERRSTQSGGTRSRTRRTGKWGSAHAITCQSIHQSGGARARARTPQTKSLLAHCRHKPPPPTTYRHGHAHGRVCGASSLDPPAEAAPRMRRRMKMRKMSAGGAAADGHEPGHRVGAVTTCAHTCQIAHTCTSVRVASYRAEVGPGCSTFSGSEVLLCHTLVPPPNTQPEPAHAHTCTRTSAFPSGVWIGLTSNG